MKYAAAKNISENNSTTGESVRRENLTALVLGNRY